MSVGEDAATRKARMQELMDAIQPAPFRMSNELPRDAQITKSDATTWWRSNSPLRGEDRDFAVEKAAWKMEQEQEALERLVEAERQAMAEGGDAQGALDDTTGPVQVDASGYPLQGVFSWQRRAQYLSTYQVAHGPPGSFKPDEAMASQGCGGSIPGYSGFIAGKYAGNVIGGSFQRSVEDSQKHLLGTVNVQTLPQSHLSRTQP